MIGKKFLIFFVIFSCLSLAEYKVNAKLNRSRIAANESVDLIITIESSDRSSIPNLNLPRLRDFHIQGSSQTMQTSIINGNVQASKIFQYTLIPKRTGNLSVPSLSVNLGGKTHSTPALNVSVSSAGSMTHSEGTKILPNMFSVATTDKTEYFVGEPIIHTFRFFHRGNLFGQPQLREGDTINLQKINSFKEAQRSFQKTMQGRNYVVEEVQHVYRSIKPGNAVFKPSSIVYTTSPFERSRSAQTLELPITIKALPKTASSLAVVGEFSINARLESTRTKVNEGTYLLITVEGRGDLAYAQLKTPQLNSDIELFEPEITLKETIEADQIQSKKLFKILIIPRAKGNFKIPPFTMKSFNPRTKSIDVLKSSSLVLKVSGELKSNAKNNRSASPTDRIQQTLIKEENQSLAYPLANPGFLYPISNHREILILLGINLFILLGLTLKPIANLLRHKTEWEKGLMLLKKNSKNLGKINDLDLWYGEAHQLLVSGLAMMFNVGQGEITLTRIQERLTDHPEKENFLAFYSALEAGRFSTITSDTEELVQLKHLNKQFNQFVNHYLRKIKP